MMNNRKKRVYVWIGIVISLASATAIGGSLAVHDFWSGFWVFWLIFIWTIVIYFNKGPE